LSISAVFKFESKLQIPVYYPLDTVAYVLTRIQFFFFCSARN
jgi:hypothetical protein